MPTTAGGAPADTSLMGVVHSALRRDLVRARIVAAGEPGVVVDATRRAAVGAHLQWLMSTLRQHHDGEDAGLFPLVVRHNPDAATLVAVMDAEHHAIVPAMAALEDAARDYRDGAEGGRDELLAALVALDTVLLPHLAREETQIMPVVAASLTQEQWEAWNHGTNIAPKRTAELAHERHWLLDGADPRARVTVLAQVPLLPRVVLPVLGLRYAHRAQVLWAGTRAADVPALTLDELPHWS